MDSRLRGNDDGEGEDDGMQAAMGVGRGAWGVDSRLRWNDDGGGAGSAGEWWRWRFDVKLGQTSASLAYACAQEALHKLALEDEEG